MVVTDLAIIKTNVLINLSKKIEEGIWRKEIMSIGKVVMRREILNHHPETEVQHRHTETLLHGLVNHQREGELSPDKIL